MSDTADLSRDGRVLTPGQLKDLSRRSNLPGLIRAGAHYGAICLVGGLICFLKDRYGVWSAIPLIVIQGFFVAFLFMPLHESAHKTVFNSRIANVVLGHLSAFLIVLPYEYYALFHWDHHRFTQDPNRDPELLTASIPASDTQLAIAYTGIVQLVRRIVLLARHAITGRVVAPWIPEGKRSLVVREARAYAAGYVLLLVVSILFSTTVLLWTWILPLFVGQLFLRPYLYAEHTGCDRTRSVYENTRTTYTAALMRWFAWNMPFHVEHHAYPSVPFHALPELNLVIAHRIAHEGRGYRAVTIQTWVWFRRARRTVSVER